MSNWLAMAVAVLMVFVLERPGDKESRIVSSLIYFILGVFPLPIGGYSLPLGILVAIMLLVRKVDNRLLKVVAALLGALAGWVYFTWFWVPG